METTDARKRRLEREAADAAEERVQAAAEQIAALRDALMWNEGTA